jgi:hypothetical protein
MKTVPVSTSVRINYRSRPAAAGCVRVFLSLFTARQDYARLASVYMVSTVISTSSMLVLIVQIWFSCSADHVLVVAA